MNILITGAARGIGRELVRQYLAEGNTVVAATRGPASGLESFPGGKLIPVAMDVADPDSIQVAKTLIATQIDHVDILFNNAGVSGEGDHFEDFDPRQFLRTIEINTISPVIVSRAFLPLLEKSAAPVVLTLSSRTGVLFKGEPKPGSSYAYCSSKAALHRLLPFLAADLAAFGIISVGIDPGFVDTDMTGGQIGDRFKLTPEMSVRGIRHVAAAVTLKHSGAFLRWDGQSCQWFPAPESDRDLQLIAPTLSEPFNLEAGTA